MRFNRTFFTIQTNVQVFFLKSKKNEFPRCQHYSCCFLLQFCTQFEILWAELAGMKSAIKLQYAAKTSTIREKVEKKPSKGKYGILTLNLPDETNLRKIIVLSLLRYHHISIEIYKRKENIVNLSA